MRVSDFSARPIHTLAPVICGIFLLAVACRDSTNTSVVGPSDSKCGVSVTTSTTPLPAAGGSGSLTVTSPRECSWSARADASWITLSGSDGRGNATLSYSAVPNPEGAPRRAAVVINERRVEITQEAAPCRFGVSPAAVDAAADGGAVTLRLAGPGGCAWTARTDDAWLTPDAAEGQGSAAVRLAVAPNPGGARSGVVALGGVNVRVSQAGASSGGQGPRPPAPGPAPAPTCRFDVSPARATAAAAGERITVTIATQEGCGWGVISGASWIRVAEGANGSGTGVARLAIDPNPGSARSASVAVANATLTITQNGIVCTYGIKPTYYNAGRGPDEVAIDVTAPDGCAWTAVSPAAWAAIAAGRSGSGSGTVRLRVDPNGGGLREATLTVAGQPFALRQLGCAASIKPTYYNAGRGPDDIRIVVTADPGCAWTASSPVSWVHVAEGANGSGTGVVRLLVDPNGGQARSVTLTVAGQAFELSQTGSQE